ncbi:TIGR03750 family conjugal transfer protein [Citrobacter koseri]|uniref:TIGR03750 family conjugal transfer protein n=1 Tax=Citrobacter koseri TaxID=545 RepID=UPI003891FEF1
MAVIDFLPDRLNNPPVVWKGYTSGEFILSAACGMVAGIPVAVPLSFVSFIGWLAFPAGMLLMPLLFLFSGGVVISRLKRGKPENFIWQRLERFLCRLRFSSSLLLASRGWEMRRTRQVKPGGGV